MPLPVAHGLIGASAVAALLPLSRTRIAKPLLLGVVLGVSPDFDYALNWLRIGRGGWHHGFTHSIPFALLIGLVTTILLREWKARSFVVFSAAFASHTLLDFLITESMGVAAVVAIYEPAIQAAVAESNRIFFSVGERAGADQGQSHGGADFCACSIAHPFAPLRALETFRCGLQLVNEQGQDTRNYDAGPQRRFGTQARAVSFTRWRCSPFIRRFHRELSAGSM